MFVGEATRSDSLSLTTAHELEKILCEADTNIGFGRFSSCDSGLLIGSTDSSPIGPSVT